MVYYLMEMRNSTLTINVFTQQLSKESTRKIEVTIEKELIKTSKLIDPS